MLKNTSGKKDAMLTLAVLSTGVVLIKVLLAGVTLTLGETVLAFGAIDSGIVGAILAPTLSAYVARRYTDHRFKVINGDNPAVEGKGIANAGQP